MIELWVLYLTMTFCFSYTELLFLFRVLFSFILVMFFFFFSYILSYHSLTLSALPLAIVLFLWFFWAYSRVLPLSFPFLWLIHMDGWYLCSSDLGFFFLSFHSFMVCIIVYFFHSFSYLYHWASMRSIIFEFLYLLHCVCQRHGDCIIRIIEISFHSFLLPYYLSLHFILGLKTTLRPWHYALCLIAHTWATFEIGWRSLRALWMRNYERVYTGA